MFATWLRVSRIIHGEIQTTSCAIFIPYDHLCYFYPIRPLVLFLSDTATWPVSILCLPRSSHEYRTLALDTCPTRGPPRSRLAACLPCDAKHEPTMGAVHARALWDAACVPRTDRYEEARNTSGVPPLHSGGVVPRSHGPE